MPTASTRLMPAHRPGLRPGANASTTSSMTASTTGMARLEMDSMMGVSQGRLRRSTKKEYAMLSR